MVTRDLIDEGIRGLIEGGTQKEVYLGGIGTRTPTVPYAMVYPMPTGPDLGSWGQPNEDREYTYQIKCVGSDSRQTAWMSSKVNEVMTNRSGADYEFPLNITGVAAHWRVTDTLGAIVPTGSDLFESNDIYKVRIGV